MRLCYHEGMRRVLYLALMLGYASIGFAEDDPRELEAAVRGGKYEDVAASLERARGPAFLPVQLALALARGQYASAEALCAPQAACTSSERVALLHARALYEQGKLERAIAVLQKSARNPTHLSALAKLADLHALRGERAEAERNYHKLIDAFNDGRVAAENGRGMAAVAAAARALGAIKDANQSFAEATRAAPDDVEIEHAWAELFLDKYDIKNAERSITRILSINPRDALALERLARIRLEQGADFAQVGQMLHEALLINPALVSAHVSLAGLALRDMQLESAQKHLDEALRINPRNLEALSVRAAQFLLADDRAGFERAVAAMLKENPRYSRGFSIIATYAEWEHRYEELVTLADRALRIDPDDAYAYATRGLNLLRTGDEKAGIAALEQAWSKDRYNVRVFNTLNLYEDVIAKEYVDSQHAPFKMRFHRDDELALKPYAARLLERGYEDMKKRYGFTPKGPLSVELYARSDHFSIRTSGLPHLGVQGVCFGKVVTALSPSAEEVNWGQILWHELSHVFHVQLSNSRVPRWFTEGLAEWETEQARPEWKREDDRALWDALAADEVPKLAELNLAFTHARTPQALMSAYYASTQAVAFLVNRYGFAVVPKMLALWGKGQRTNEVFFQALGTDIDSVDRELRSTLKTRLAAKYGRDFRVDIARYADLEVREKKARAQGASAADRAGYALALAYAKKHAEAMALANDVLGTSPAEPLALFARAHVALVERKPAAADKYLRALLAAGHESYQARMLLARVAVKREAFAEAVSQAEAAIKIDAERPEAYDVLIRAAEALHDEAKLTSALERYVAIDQHSPRPLRKLLPLLFSQGRMDALARRAEDGLYVDPQSPVLHQLLAEAWLRTGRPKDALFEAAQAAKLAPEPAEKGRAELLRARAHLALGEREQAKKASAAAVALDPSLSEQASALFSR
jgi:tetratricopeptide (TPR) repeat protein